MYPNFGELTEFFFYFLGKIRLLTKIGLGYNSLFQNWIRSESLILPTKVRNRNKPVMPMVTFPSPLDLESRKLKGSIGLTFTIIITVMLN